MSNIPTGYRAIILVKALPRPSSGYSETVCCAAITDTGIWKRLYPVRYRHTGESFGRWDIIEFQGLSSARDKRVESCRLIEGSIRKVGQLSAKHRRQLIEPLITSSTAEAFALGRSLTAIRPSSVHFLHREKSAGQILAERDAYIRASAQLNILDEQVEPFNPTPHHLAFSFDDATGKHTFQCGDWETHATFWKWNRQYGERETLLRMKQKFEVDYSRDGVVFILGTIAKRPRQWTLLGVVRVDDGPYQHSLF